ncbi:sodium/potassium-transporting ATPase subunit beta-1-like [Hyposmocoma kahamanoa]|uniref:sodium/potassium-transporting ATPase subunit beta-1-like n=1 Tax=Hyposmocoma kahamanoa TaxID=1477025 RepID=UPI000E6D6D4A|nr:sodium/potassium-transporting ATPase subunit beta-1-like [Hyposmocoma kahamanoa]
MATSKSNGVDSTDWSRIPQESGPLWRRILRAIYNSEEKSFLGRTAKRWGIVVTFYLVFYACLAAMFALCLGGLFLTLDDKRPTYILQESLIGTSPGLAYRPYPAEADSPRAIDEYKWKFLRDNVTAHEDFQRRLATFLDPRGHEQPSCSRNDSYGFPDSPCFVIKLNKMLGWSPEYYSVSELPEDMPEDLRQHITGLNSVQSQQIWVSCLDEEGGNKTVVEYPWGRGLVGFITVVKIKPTVDHLTKVRCRAWAKNIRYNGSLKDNLAAGYTRIQMLIASKRWE